jgi:predicted nuclease of predicted toxin-antitoxin system
MKILLDENLPKKLKQHFQEHQIFTVTEKGWKGKQNGDLLQLMANEGFDLLITFDKNLKYQQNLSRYRVTVFVLKAEDNTYESLTPLIPKIKYELSRLTHSTVVTIQPT